MQESLAPKHGGELLANPSEHLLDGGGVPDESGREFQPSGGNVTHAGLHIIGDPFHEVGRVLVLHIDHLFVHLFGAHFPPEHGGGGEVAAVTRVGGAHHVLGVPHLLGQFRDRERDVLLGSAGGQWGKSYHEEMEAWEWDQIHCQLPEAVEVTNSRKLGGFENKEIVEVFLSFLSNLNRFDVKKRSLAGRYHRELHYQVPCTHLHSPPTDELRVWHCMAQQQCQRLWVMGKQRSLLTHNIENGIDQLSAFGVMSFGPVIPGTVLSEDKVIRSEDLAKRSRSNAIHRTRLEIHKDGARHVPATGSLIEIHIDALELEIAGTAAVAALVTAGGVNAVLVADNLPEFGANLIAALASLNV
nr:uncharacterized protein BOVATA_006360 [Ipomoea trifida]